MRKTRYPYLEPTEASCEEEPRRFVPRERKPFEELRQSTKIKPIEQ